MPVHRRDIGMVFQNYALFPHMTVFENIAFGLEVRGTPTAEIEQRVQEMLALVRLPGLGGRKPRQLSGGQQQRVALARALVTRPRVLLLDEPLGALDKRLRQEMQVELRQIQREVGITTIFVTHDQEEALTLSDRIAIFNEGTVVQVGTPQEVYERPLTVFAAQFLGDANIFHGTPVDGGLRLGDGTVIGTAGPCKGTAIVRPEKITVRAGQESPRGNAFGARCCKPIYSGASVTYRIRTAALGDVPLLAFAQNQSGELLAPGSQVVAAWDAGHTIPVDP